MKRSADPIGLKLTRVSRKVSRAFDAALGQGGGSLPLWLVLLSLKSQQHAAQRDIAEAIGIEGATLTHHLNRMEEDGLIERRRDPENRRVQRVSLSSEGEERFRALLTRVIAFDRQLRAGLSEEELSSLRGLLERLESNAESALAKLEPVK